MEKGFTTAHGIHVVLEIVLTADRMFPFDCEAEQGILGADRQRIAVHIQKDHADPVRFGKIVLKGLQLIFADKLKPLFHGTGFLFHHLTTSF